MDIVIQVIGVITVVSVFYYIFIGEGSKRRYFRKHGIPAVGKVVNAEKTLLASGYGNNTEPVYILALDINEFGSTTRQIKIKQALRVRDIPVVGDTMNILIDPKDPEKAMIVDKVKQPD